MEQRNEQKDLGHLQLYTLVDQSKNKAVRGRKGCVFKFNLRNYKIDKEKSHAKNKNKNYLLQWIVETTERFLQVAAV